MDMIRYPLGYPNMCPISNNFPRRPKIYSRYPYPNFFFDVPDILIFTYGPDSQALTVIIYLDIKNTFNTVNHSAVFFIIEDVLFPEADIYLFSPAYS